VTITTPHPGLPSGALLIGDERLDEASGGGYDHVNPTTGLVQNRIPIAGTSEVDLAVGVARRAFPAWRAMEPNVRRNLLLDLADMSLAKRLVRCPPSPVGLVTVLGWCGWSHLHAWAAGRSRAFPRWSSPRRILGSYFRAGLLRVEPTSGQPLSVR
jgi:hypothetical protein